MNSIYIEPAARLDIEEASGWYEAQRTGLGIEFLLELDLLLEQISVNPEAFVTVYLGFHRGLMRRFPYAAYFTFHGNSVRLQAVLHQHRSERFVSSRLE